MADVCVITDVRYQRRRKPGTLFAASWDYVASWWFRRLVGRWWVGWPRRHCKTAEKRASSTQDVLRAGTTVSRRTRLPFDVNPKGSSIYFYYTS